MTSEETVRLVISFLGGGVVAGMIAAVTATLAEWKRREIAHLQNQLNSLYGPLHFYVSLNGRFFELNDRFHTAYNMEFVGRQWTPDPATQEALAREVAVTLNIANEYINQVKKNNDEVMKILRGNWSLIEPDDLPILSRFQVDYSRMRTEVGEEGRLRTPLLIYRRIGDISFMQQQFIQHVERKFQAKRMRLNTLLRIKDVSVPQ